MISAEQLADFAAALRPRVAGELRTDRMTRTLYSTDASLYQVMPHAVFLPRTADDVAAAVSVAAAHDLPVLARAAGTSLAGQAVNAALVIDFTRHLDRILAIDPAARRAVVQPGVVLDDLNAALRAHGLQFGPDPASSDRSTVGGAVANNASGSHSTRYGMTADHVLAMDVVLADGSPARLVNGQPPDGADGIAAGVADPGVMDVSTTLWGHLNHHMVAKLERGDREGFNHDMAMGARFSKALRFVMAFRFRPYALETPYDVFTAVREYALDEATVAAIRCPMLVTDPEDEQFWPGQSRRLYDALRCPKDIIPFTREEGASGHCEPVGLALRNQRVLDWLDERVPAG